MWFICPWASRRFRVGENGCLASGRELETRPAGWLIQWKEVSNLGTLAHSTFWLHGVLSDSCPLEIHVDLHVICQEGRRQAHNKQNEHVFSISVLGLVHVLCTYIYINIIASIQWSLGSVRLENVFKVRAYSKHHHHWVCPKSGLTQKDHSVASIVETVCFISSLPLGKTVRHLLSQWSWCCGEEIRG